MKTENKNEKTFIAELSKLTQEWGREYCVCGIGEDEIDELTDDALVCAAAVYLLDIATDGRTLELREALSNIVNIFWRPDQMR